nr:phosphoribosylglycinamide formyltransferase, chloroplastic [Tanacetum cinerariifolium]
METLFSISSNSIFSSLQNPKASTFSAPLSSKTKTQNLVCLKSSCCNVLKGFEGLKMMSVVKCLSSGDEVGSLENGDKRKKNLAVFVSGGGSNFRAVHKAILSGDVNGEVVVLVTNKNDCGGAQYARENGIPVIIFPNTKGEPEGLSSNDLVAALSTYKIDFIFLAGYLKLIPSELIRAYPNSILNIHPSLLPAFGGKGYYGTKVHKAVIASGARYSGPTIHFVDENYDTGRILAQRVVPVLANDTAEELAARVLRQEHKMYAEVAAAICEERVIWREDEEAMASNLIHTKRLEDFPELINKIQSMLESKEAARTCVLSKSWLHAWSMIPNLRGLRTIKVQNLCRLRVMKTKLMQNHKLEIVGVPNLRVFSYESLDILPKPLSFDMDSLRRLSHLHLEFYPSHEMQKLETELWNHAMVGAGHVAYTDRFHELARLVPHLVTPKSRKIESDDNNMTRNGNTFATTANPVGRENAGAWPKCATCNSYHAQRGSCRICFNYNCLGHFAKDCRGLLRNVNHVNARNPPVRACYECGRIDHVRSIFMLVILNLDLYIIILYAALRSCVTTLMLKILKAC